MSGSEVAAEGRLWAALGRQLSHPQGWKGRLVAPLMRAANARPTRAAVEALAPGAHDFVLDLGCGSGDAVRLIAARVSGGQVCGIDRSELMIAAAARANRAAIRAGRVRLAVGSFEALPYPDGAFDKLLACNVVYFWHDEAAVLAEVRRVLRPGGKLVVYATDAASMTRWKFAGAATHRLFDAAALQALIEGGGLAVDRVDRVALPGGVAGLVATAERR